MNEKAKNILGWLGIAAVVLACVCGMFGKKILVAMKYAGTKMAYEVRADAKSKAAVNSRMRKSMLWKAYFASVDSGDSDSAIVYITVRTERKLFGPPINEPNRYNSNGHVAAWLTVTERGRAQPVYKREIQYKLPAAFTFTAQSTGNGQEDVFLDTERSARNEITAYLEVAAMRAMALRPDKAESYCPALVSALDDNQLVISRTAADVLCGFGAAARSVKPEIEKIAAKKMGTGRIQAKRVLVNMPK